MEGITLAGKTISFFIQTMPVIDSLFSCSFLLLIFLNKLSFSSHISNFLDMYHMCKTRRLTKRERGRERERKGGTSRWQDLWLYYLDIDNSRLTYTCCIELFLDKIISTVKMKMQIICPSHKMHLFVTGITKSNIIQASQCIIRLLLTKQM